MASRDQSMSAPPIARPALSPEHHHARLNDPHRLRALQATGLLDGEIAPVLDRLTRIASVLLNVPVSAVSLVDDLGQHFPGLTGLGGWAGERRGTPLSHAFCQHVVARDEPLIVENAPDDPLVADNLAVAELGVIAYAGVPIRLADGTTLGAFCAIDTVPKRWTAEQLGVLHDLASAASAEIELRSTVRALRASEEKLREQAMRDPLTGLLNRRGFSDVARQHLALVQRTRQPFCIVMMDLDRFKQINDRFGHDAGDEALVEMAALLTRCVRESDAVARLGGDEFLVLLTGADESQGHRFLGRVCTALSERNLSTGTEYTLHSSMGLGVWTADAPLSLAHVLHAADTAMYANKRARVERVA